MDGCQELSREQLHLAKADGFNDALTDSIIAAVTELGVRILFGDDADLEQSSVGGYTTNSHDIAHSHHER